jgi:Tfp pilus assembly protein PilN
MIYINLHDYREELRKIETQKRVVKATSVVCVIILLVVVNWMVMQTQLDKVRGETQKLEMAVKALEPRVNAIQKMKTSKLRREKIVEGIDRLRGKQFPVGKIINDLNMAVPEGVWLERVTQLTATKLQNKKVPVILFGDPALTKKKKKRKKKRKNKKNETPEFIEISGKALNEQLIAEYIKNLQEIPYYKLTFLHKSSQTIMGGYPIYSFTAYSYMPEKKKKK